MLLEYYFPKVLNKVSTPSKDYLVKNYPLRFFIPHMSFGEYKLLCKHTESARKVIEFGSGGSTFLFLRNKKRIFSIENHKPFFDFMKSLPAINDTNLSYYFVDLGETGDWGRPVNNAKENQWSAYYSNVWLNPEASDPDVVFIDGRFRVMCALTAITKIKSSTKVIIHDFINRPYYQSVLEFYDIIDKNGSLVILKPKSVYAQEKFEEVQKEFRLDYR